MSLLRDIQNAALDSKVHLPDLLRKCKVLAARLGNQDFKAWVDAELNGYGEKDSLPGYRSFRVESKGNFAGPMGSGLNRVPIPLSCPPSSLAKCCLHITLESPSAPLRTWCRERAVLRPFRFLGQLILSRTWGKTFMKT